MIHRFSYFQRPRISQLNIVEKYRSFQVFTEIYGYEVHGVSVLVTCLHQSIFYVAVDQSMNEDQFILFIKAQKVSATELNQFLGDHAFSEHYVGMRFENLEEISLRWLHILIYSLF